MRATRLQVQDLLDLWARENAMAPSLALGKAEPEEERTEPFKGDVRVRRPAQDLEEELLVLSHAGNLPTGQIPRHETTGRAPNGEASGVDRHPEAEE